MAKWYDQYLTEQERKHLQVGQKGIRARARKQAEADNRGYPKSSIPVSQPDWSNAQKGIEARNNSQTAKKSLEEAFNKKNKYTR